MLFWLGAMALFRFMYVCLLMDKCKFLKGKHLTNEVQMGTYVQRA